METETLPKIQSDFAKLSEKCPILERAPDNCPNFGRLVDFGFLSLAAQNAQQKPCETPEILIRARSRRFNL